MRSTILGLALAVALSAAGAARADFNLDFDWTQTSNGTGVQPANPEVFSAVGDPNYKITAYGAGPALNGSPAALYVKANGHGESGLGLTNDPSGDHEVTPGSFIQLNFASLKSLIGTGALTFNISSVQSNEGFALYASNSASLPTSADKPLWSVVNTTSHDALYTQTFDPSVLSQYTYFSLTALGKNADGRPSDPGDVLLGELTIRTAAVPEPGSVALFGMGLIGMFGLAWRRRLQARSV